MGNKARKIEQAEQQKKNRKKLTIIVASASLCVIAAVVTFVIVQSTQIPRNQNNPPTTSAATMRLSPDANGDLRVPFDSLQGSNITYINYGGHEDLIVYRNAIGEYRTAFDTCEECYPRGNVRFTLRGNILVCSACGTQQAVSVLGTAEWGGCRPVSITRVMREDTATELVIPAAVLAYARDMFSHWNAHDFSVSFDVYGTPDAHVHSH